MEKREEKICSFTQKGTRLQLIRINRFDRGVFIYEVRLNRKIISNSISENNERKQFATYCKNIVLQLKI